MKKILIILLVLLAVGAVAYRAYSFFLSASHSFGTGVAGSGNIKTEARSVGPFKAIHLSGIGHAMITRTGQPGLSISSDDNLLPLLVSEVQGGTLYLSIKDGTNIRSGNIEYRITIGDLREIDVSGAASLQAADLDGAALAVTLSGASRARLSGRVDRLTADVSGASSLDAAALSAKRATVEASGAAQASVNAGDTLDANASGAASIDYRGRPKLTSHTSGAGTIRSGS